MIFKRRNAENDLDGCLVDMYDATTESFTADTPMTALFLKIKRVVVTPATHLDHSLVWIVICFYKTSRSLTRGRKSTLTVINEVKSNEL